MFNEKLYRIISVLGAILIWSLWAFYINHGSFNSRMTSAICQGLISGLATPLMIDALKIMNLYFKSFLTPPLIVTSITTLAGGTIHFLIGTSEIIATLSPAVSVALIFSLITSYNLKKNTDRESV